MKTNTREEIIKILDKYFDEHWDVSEKILDLVEKEKKEAEEQLLDRLDKADLLKHSRAFKNVRLIIDELEKEE